MSTESVMPSYHLILCCPLLLLPSVFPSIRVFFSESVLRIMWPKYWSFSRSSNPSNEYSGLISFRMDWLNLLAVQGTLKSLRTMLSKSLIQFSVDGWDCIPALFFGLRQPPSKGLMPGLGFLNIFFDKIKINQPHRASLAVQWLRCCIPKIGGCGFYPWLEN